MAILGIDIGTTTVCCKAVREGDCGEILSRTVKNDSFIETPNAYERIQDPERLISIARSLISEVREALDEPVTAIGITGQMHGIVYIDKNGASVSPLYIWQDMRGGLEYKDGLSYAEYITAKTGYRCAPGYGFASHLYNLTNGLVPEAAVSLCTIHDYLAANLCGLRRPVTHQSDAASLSLYDAKNARFDADAARAVGIDPAIFPDVVSATAFIGKTEDGIPVAAAIGDNQASFLGSVEDPESSILLNVGTSGQISVIGDPEKGVGAIEARPFLDDSYLLVGCSLCGGRSYALLEKFFRDVCAMCGCEITSAYPFMDRAMEKFSPDACTLSVSTKFDGTREDPSERGSITGIDTYNMTPENLMYGYMKGIATELYDMYRGVASDGEVKKLVGSGNAVRVNPMLRTILSELFKGELTVPDCKEEAAHGAAKFAQLCLNN